MKSAAKAYYIPRWFKDHEPHPKNGRLITSPLSGLKNSYFREPAVRSGEGRMVISNKYGDEKMLQASGLFYQMKVLTAQLPYNYRGWVCAMHALPSAAMGLGLYHANLSHYFGVRESTLVEMCQILCDVRWLVLKTFRLNNLPPSSPKVPPDCPQPTPQKEKETEKETESKSKIKTEMERSDSDSDFSNLAPSVSSSDSDLGSQVAGKYKARSQIMDYLRVKLPTQCLDERASQQAKSDYSTIENQVDHFWKNQHVISRSIEIAAEISKKPFIEKPVSMWIARLKREDFFYGQHKS